MPICDPITETSASLSPEDVHRVLSNERRRLIVEALRDVGGKADARTLSERVASGETGENPPPASARHNVYVSLQQHHLPMLDRLDVIEYDKQRKTVRLGDAAETVIVYCEDPTPQDMTFGECALLLGFLGILTALAAPIGVPGLASLNGWIPALGISVILFVSAGYHVRQQGGVYVDKLRPSVGWNAGRRDTE